MNMTLVPLAMVLLLIAAPATAGALEECQTAGDKIQRDNGFVVGLEISHVQELGDP